MLYNVKNDKYDYCMQNIRETIDKIKIARARSDELRRVQSKAVSRYEIAAYSVLPLALVMAGAMPSSGLILMPIILVLCYLLYRRFDAVLPLSAIAVYGVLSLTINYDILSVIYLVFLVFALCGLILSAQIRPYLLCVTVAAVAAALGFFAGAGVVRLASGKSLPSVAEEYVIAERDDPIVSFVARYEYDHAELPAGVNKIGRGEAGYADETIKYMSSVVNDEIRGYLLYYCLHYGAVIGGIGYFFAVALNRRTASCEDIGADEENIGRSTRSLGGVRRELVRVADMSTPRAFLWSCLLPAFVAGVVLEVIGGYDAISATIMHAFVTLPAGFAFITIMCYFASQFSGKGRIAADIVFGILCAATAVSPTVLFFGSMIGVADIVLNLRFWTQFLRSE